jgi:hypothetical protein
MTIQQIAATMIRSRHGNHAYGAFIGTFGLSPEEASRELSKYPAETLQRVHIGVVELLDSHTLNRLTEQALENYLDLLPSEE